MRKCGRRDIFRVCGQHSSRLTNWIKTMPSIDRLLTLCRFCFHLSNAVYLLKKHRWIFFSYLDVWVCVSLFPPPLIGCDFACLYWHFYDYIMSIRGRLLFSHPLILSANIFKIYIFFCQSAQIWASDDGRAAMRSTGHESDLTISIQVQC